MSSSTAIRAGRAFVELFTEDGKFQAGLARAQARLKSFASSAGAMGASLAAAGGVITAPFAAAAGVFQQTGDALHKMAQRTGASVEALSQLKFAAGQSGSSLEAIERGLKKMSTVIDAARRGSDTASESLDRLGLTVADLAARRPEQQLELFADALARIKDPTLRATAAMQIFGEEGTQLLPLLAGGARGIQQLRQQADELGLTMSTSSANAAADFGDALGELQGQLQALTFAIGGAVASGLTDWIRDSQQALAQAIAWAKANGDTLVSVAALGAGLAGLGVGIKAVALAAGGLATGIGGVARGLALLRTAAMTTTAAMRGLGSWLAVQGLPSLIAWSSGLRDAVAGMSRMQLASFALKGALAGALAIGVWTTFAAAAQAEMQATQDAVETMTAQSLASLRRLRDETRAVLDQTQGNISGQSLEQLEERKARLQQERRGAVDMGMLASRQLTAELQTSWVWKFVQGRPDDRSALFQADVKHSSDTIAAIDAQLAEIDRAIAQQRAVLDGTGATRPQPAVAEQAPSGERDSAREPTEKSLDPALLQALAERTVFLQQAGEGLLARAAAGQSPQQTAELADRLGNDLQQLAEQLRQAGLLEAAEGIADRAKLFDDLAESLATVVDPARLRTAAEASQAERLQQIDAQARAGRFEVAAALADRASQSAQGAGDQLAARFFANQADTLRSRAEQTEDLNARLEQLPRTLARSAAQNRALELGSSEAVAAIAGVLSPEERHNRRMEELQGRNVAASERAARSADRTERHLRDAAVVTPGRV